MNIIKLFKLPINRRCSGDDSCPPPLKCVMTKGNSHKTCQITKCQQREDCPPDWKCVDKFCVPKVTCQDSGDCSKHEVH